MSSMEVGSVPSALSLLAEGLRYYIVRPGNSMVPLVPVDQLPFQLHHIPRQLSHQQLSQGKWAWVADTKEVAYPLALQAPMQALAPKHASQLQRFLAPDHKVRAKFIEPTPLQGKERFQTISSSPMAVQDVSLPVYGANNVESGNRPTSLTESIANIYQKDAQRLSYSPRVLPPSGIEPDPTKKEYCTHWIKTGDCAFVEQGCRYKHEMPSLDKLHHIGFKSIPRWWKEKSAPRGLTWMQRRLQAEQDDEGDQPPPTPRQGPVRELFKRIESHSGRDMYNTADSGHTHDTVTEEHVRRTTPEREQTSTPIPDLIDFNPPAPPPSRRSSSTSATTTSIAASGSSSNLSSVVPSPHAVHKLPSSESAPAESSSTPSVAEKELPVLHLNCEISSSSDEEEVVEQILTRNLTRKSAKAIPPKPAKKPGLAKSKHAVKGNENTFVHPKTTLTQSEGNAPSGTLQREITKLKREHHRRGKKGARNAAEAKNIPNAKKPVALT